jgi:hypothetical protein
LQVSATARFLVLRCIKIYPVDERDQNGSENSRAS